MPICVHTLKHVTVMQTLTNCVYIVRETNHRLLQFHDN